MSVGNEMKFVLKQIIKNQKRFIKSKLGNHTSTVGATHLSKSTEESIQYINEVFEDYLQYGKLSSKDVLDKTILEVGPGDNFGVALSFLALGAKKVYLIDKFYSERNQNQQLNIYRKLRESLDESSKKYFDEAIELNENDFLLNPSKIEYIYGVGLEESAAVFEKEGFDYIISRAVIQEISDTKTTFEKMHELLKSGGVMLHKIDLRGYGTFTKRKNHGLGSLMYAPLIYKLMTNHSGLPNRKRVNHYRDLLEVFGFQYEMFVSHIFGEKEKNFNPHKLEIKFGEDYDSEDVKYIESVRKNLYREFRNLPAIDLLISGFFLIAHKK